MTPEQQRNWQKVWHKKFKSYGGHVNAKLQNHYPQVSCINTVDTLNIAKDFFVDAEKCINISFKQKDGSISAWSISHINDIDQVIAALMYIRSYMDEANE